MTVGDKVRSMTDEELTLLFTRFFRASCRMMMKYPGADMEWIKRSSVRAKGVLKRHFKRDADEVNWKWLGRVENA